MKERILFFGSPEFAASVLSDLLDAQLNIVGVVTQPDKPVGRKQILTPPPVKELAQENSLPIFQPRTLKDGSAVEELTALKPDLCIVASYGKILPLSVLELAPRGCINVHASILPKYRGSTPIQSAVRAKEPTTGITIMLMDEGLDTGPILSARELDILADDTAGSLSERLAKTGSALLIETIPGYLSGEIKPQTQDGTKATKTSLLKKEHGRIDWSQTPDMIEAFIRAMTPWPGAFTEWNGIRLLIKKAHLQEGELVIDLIQPAGKQEMDFDSFRRGHPDATLEAFARG